MDESTYISKCLRIIEEKQGWGAYEIWSDYHFKSLSEEISETTKISISVPTLKRLFGKISYHPDYKPQNETKKSLALFLGYKNWEDFKRAIEPSLEGFVEDSAPSDWKSKDASDQIKLERSTGFIRKNKKWALIFLFAFFICLIFCVGYFYNESGQKAWLTSDKLIVTRFNTVFFKFDISKVKSDSVFIDFGDNTILSVSKGHSTISHFYYVPGYYEVSLMAERKKVASLKVQVLSIGWQAYLYIFKDKARYVIDQSMDSGFLHIPVHQINSLLKDGKQWSVNFYNIKDYPIEADNFSLETRVKNVKTPNFFRGRCRCSIKIQVQAEHHPIHFDITEPGCFYRAGFVFGDKIVSGEFVNLSTFEQDLFKWSVIKLVVQNKIARLYYDGNLIYSNSYNQSPGKIKGIILTFDNNGMVDYINLQDLKNGKLYKDGFDR